MKKETKNRKNNFKDVNLSKTYSPMDAIKLLKEKSYVKFEKHLIQQLNQELIQVKLIKILEAS